MISPEQCRILITLADELHFGITAERLGIAQPQLSLSVRRIEEICGVKLFQRRPKVRLTPAGKIMVDLAHRTLRELEAGVRHAREVGLGVNGQVVLGFTGTAMLTDLPSKLHQFADANPMVRLRLVEASSVDLIVRLDRGELDLIVTRQPPDAPRCRSVKLIPESICLIVPDNHPAASADHVKLRNLECEKFVAMKGSSAPLYLGRMMRACEAAGLKPTIEQEVESVTTMLALVRAGFGIALVTDTLARAPIPGLVLVRLSDPLPDVGFSLCYYPGRLASSGERLASFLKNSFA